MKYFVLITLFCISITSCKSSKNSIENTNAIKEMSARNVAKKHTQANFKQKTVDAHLKIKYTNPTEKIAFSVRMKIEKGETIWLKGTKFITVFKAKITQNKIQFYSPLYKNYFDGDFKMLQKILGTTLNFNQLQNMLLGQSVLNVRDNRQNIAIHNNAYQLSPRKQAELFDIFFQINPKHYKLNKQSIVNTSKKQRLDISYPKYYNEKGVLFPQQIYIHTKEPKKFTNIDIITKSVAFNTNINIDFKIPKGYKEIKL
ncbi:DUF4292 domain-containing protein [Tenacibaculum piscium]|uniref:DUF4292 domain-containing protein n=1 Tax=Tenacibaculum piscium TaxID=1458515 RepID=UPI001F427383|nr:DUF4292 domain-containing protein [Tenacibaculum piscium]